MPSKTTRFHCLVCRSPILWTTARFFFQHPLSSRAEVRRRSGEGEKRGISGRLPSTVAQCAGALFPAGLHICHSCSKPIHYPDGIFYADLKDVFDVEYYGVHAELFYRLIESDTLTEYRPHTYAAIKQLQNFPASRSLAEDHRKTEFFGSNQCDSVHGCHYEAGRGGTLQEECSEVRCRVRSDWTCPLSALWLE